MSGNSEAFLKIWRQRVGMESRRAMESNGEHWRALELVRGEFLVGSGGRERVG